MDWLGGQELRKDKIGRLLTRRLGMERIMWIDLSK